MGLGYKISLSDSKIYSMGKFQRDNESCSGPSVIGSIKWKGKRQMVNLVGPCCEGIFLIAISLKSVACTEETDINYHF